MVHRKVVVFVCEHGAAKSVVAATYFNKLATELGLNLQAIPRGTHPDPELSPRTISGLVKDGLMPIESVPRKISLAEVESAERVIAFCELPVEYADKSVIEHWDGVPAVSENYERARDAIIVRLEKLISDL